MFEKHKHQKIMKSLSKDLLLNSQLYQDIIEKSKNSIKHYGLELHEGHFAEKFISFVNTKKIMINKSLIPTNLADQAFVYLDSLSHHLLNQEDLKIDNYNSNLSLSHLLTLQILEEEHNEAFTNALANPDTFISKFQNSIPRSN